MARLIYLIEPPDGHARQNSTPGIEFNLTIGWQPFFISPNRRPDNHLILPRERIVLPYKPLWSGRGCYRRWANSPSMTFAQPHTLPYRRRTVQDSRMVAGAS